MEELGDHLLFVDGDAMALQLADERLQVEGEVIHHFTILELEVGVLLLQKLGCRLLPRLLSRALRPQWLPVLHQYNSEDRIQH